jgi:hypothetical protein
VSSWSLWSQCNHTVPAAQATRLRQTDVSASAAGGPTRRCRARKRATTTSPLASATRCQAAELSTAYSRRTTPTRETV